MINRAYSALHIKSFDEQGEFITLRGIASTPTVDSMGDIVNPMGAEFQTPMPLLWQHMHDMPVGHVTFASPIATGIPFEAQIPIIKEAGRLKDRIDEAIHSLKYKLVVFVSIGFSAIEGAMKKLPNGGIQFDRWIWRELSLVTIPAQSEAVITSVKSLGTADWPRPLSQDLIKQIKAADDAAPAWLCPACAAPLQAIKSIDQQHLKPASGPVAGEAPAPSVLGQTTAAPRGPVKLIPRNTQ